MAERRQDDTHDDDAAPHGEGERHGDARSDATDSGEHDHDGTTEPGERDNPVNDGVTIGERDNGNLPAPRPDSSLDSPAETAAESRPEPGSELSARPPSEPLSDEELRQFREFQEFQRFREYQAQNGELPPALSREVQPSGWRQRTPAWLTALASKLVTAVLVLIAVAAAAAWAINHYLGGSSEPSSAELAEQGGKKAEATKLYAEDPYEAVRDVYRRIAQQDPRTGQPQVDKVCLRFDENGRRQFTANMGAATCPDAVIALNKDVEHVTDYVQSLPRSTPYEVYDEVSGLAEGESYTIKSCEAARSIGGTITGGPALGTFIVTRIPDAKGEQWLITGHEPGPRSCPTPKRTTPN
ncbi:hypothetical protein [Haloechinothrix salitolerans]|uniref:Uncharacterized protein n=1 Tax=Haloechinothrix salitolerans TaxID=926830 RepID=A0ABW2C9K2_9PSEU